MYLSYNYAYILIKTLLNFIIEIMFDDLALFVRIIELGSLNAAARQAGIPAPTLSRRLQKLEHRLGCRLLHRSARKLQPTAEGLQYYEQCRPLLQALDEVATHLDTRHHKVAGRIRLLAPLSLASGIFGNCWPRFLARYPEVDLELILSNERQDLITSGADLALRVGALDDSAFMQKRLMGGECVLLGHNAYLQRHGEPETPEALASHTLLIAEPMTQWPFLDPTTGQTRVFIPKRARMRVNDFRVVLRAVEAGTGLLYCPLSLCRDLIANGECREVLADWRAPARPIYALWPSREYVPMRVKKLLEFLSEHAAEITAA